MAPPQLLKESNEGQKFRADIIQRLLVERDEADIGAIVEYFKKGTNDLAVLDEQPAPVASTPPASRSGNRRS
jgi:ribosomal 30S subunit maturation factor RimM